MSVDRRARFKEDLHVATFLIDLLPPDMQRRLPEALAIYVDAMRYPRGTEDHRASMWMEHSRRKGWRAVAAVDAAEDQCGSPSAAELADARMIGVAYGYCGAPDHWWQQQVVAGMRRAGMTPSAIGSLVSNYFELTELHIHPQAQGRGLGEALTRRLLQDRSEDNVLLSTPEIHREDNRAWRLYRRLGFSDIVRGHHFAGDPRAFAILGRRLPL
jgi:ribosomal protein S18 acetylase RimI-like enzyme